ncbi:hypothetical protein A3Q56_02497 [Intoshia linei]|uniref:CUB domain-containing protein n=1 Tax=Intoshia linei TaxID=1819745 RepID=A0A177B686_9BILA|nr:hypothetical protein A3Q56_02497 [Intoshia linei]
MNLYDSLHKYYINDTDIEKLGKDCVMDYFRFKNVCPENYNEYISINWNVKYKIVPVLMCKILCSMEHKYKCSSFFYDEKEKSCLLSSITVKSTKFSDVYVSRSVNSATFNRNCSSIYYFRRRRVGNEANVYCDFESGGKACLFKISTNIKFKDTFYIVKAGSKSSINYMIKSTDHTFESNEGHYILLPMLNGDSSYKARIYSDFMFFNNTCFEMFVKNIENITTRLNIIFKKEDMSEEIIHQVFIEKNEHFFYYKWKHVMIKLKYGYYTLIIESIRPNNVTSAVIIDDIKVNKCENFYRNCKTTHGGNHFAGKVNVSQNNNNCLYWDSVIRKFQNFKHLRHLDFSKHQNFCRNEKRIIEFYKNPFCFVEIHGHLHTEKCDIPYCACTNNEYKCKSGKCISKNLICNGYDDCGDQFDELNCNSSVKCEFSDNYICGYIRGSIGNPYKINELNMWINTNAFEAKTLLGPYFDHKHKILGKFLMVNSKYCTSGYSTIIMSPKINITDKTTLRFQLYINLLKNDKISSLTLYTQRNIFGIYTRSLFKIFHSTINSWNLKCIDLPMGEYHVVYEGTTENPDHSDISFDSVEMESGICNYMNQCDKDTCEKYISQCAKVDCIIDTCVCYAMMNSNDKDSITCNFDGSMCGYTQRSSNIHLKWVTIPKTMFQSNFDTFKKQKYQLNNNIKKIDNVQKANCDEIFTKSEGKIKSYGFPNNYTNFLDCNLRILQVSGSIIELKFLEFDLEEGIKDEKQFCYDSLKIYDGPNNNSQILYYLCGKDVPIIVRPKQHNVLLKFTSDFNVTRSGFLIYYHVIYPKNTDLIMISELIDIINYPETTYLISPYFEKKSPICFSFILIQSKNVQFRFIVEYINTLNVLMLMNIDIFIWNKFYFQIYGNAYNVIFSSRVDRFNSILVAISETSATYGYCQDLQAQSTNFDCHFNNVDICDYMNYGMGPMH